jgi:phospholipid-binding lipoprotein MlaA|tara:strand:- start:653 stop:1474 length:822 start_codon:yes stop_codon:yes gene_type:complete
MSLPFYFKTGLDQYRVPMSLSQKNSFWRIKGSLFIIFLLAYPALTFGAPNRLDSSPDTDILLPDPRDPLELINREIFTFNLYLDQWLVEPIARGYVNHIPSPIRTGIRNVLNNLMEPLGLVNNLLQGKPENAANNLRRLIINSTIGFYGIIDVASTLGIEDTHEDFGQTLAFLGVPDGPYLVIPLFGSSTARDLAGRLIHTQFTDPLMAIDDSDLRLGTLTLREIENRASVLGTEKILELQLDPYLFMRESYLQKRLNEIYDGDPPLPDEEDY